MVLRNPFQNHEKNQTILNKMVLERVPEDNCLQSYGTMKLETHKQNTRNFPCCFLLFLPMLNQTYLLTPMLMQFPFKSSHRLTHSFLIAFSTIA